MLYACAMNLWERNLHFSGETSFLPNPSLIFTSLRRSGGQHFLMSETNLEAGNISFEKLTLWAFNILWNLPPETTKNHEVLGGLQKG